MSPGDAVYWLRAHRPLERPAARLLCLPYAGGGASLFHHWSAGVPPGVEVRSAQLPGHQDRFHEPGLQSVNDIVEHLGAALKALPQAPLVVYGHSFGALLGYALAQRLRATPLSPRALVVGARRAPQLPATTSNIHHLSDSAFKQELHRRYGTSWALLQNEELMSLAMPALRADMAAVETYHYVPDAPLDIPILVLRARQDVSMSAEEPSAWREQTTQSTMIHEVDASHLFIDTHRAWVLARVAELLRGLSQNK